MPVLRKAFLSLIVVAVLLSGFLGYRLVRHLSHGQSRPASYPLTLSFRKGIEGYLDNHRNIRFVVGARWISSEGETMINLFLSSNRPVEQDFVPKLKEHAIELFGGSPKINIHIFQEVAGTEAVTYSADEKGVIKSE